MNMIFEPMDLAATASCCGMIYMEPHAMGWVDTSLQFLATEIAKVSFKGRSGRDRSYVLLDY
jgi:hypothetical protein